jgi:hypothetical protein
LPGGTEKKYEIPQSGYLVLRRLIEPGASRIQVGIVSACASLEIFFFAFGFSFVGSATLNLTALKSVVDSVSSITVVTAEDSKILKI